MSRVIIGSCLACIIAAYELGKKGEQVTLIKHRGQWGAHFGGVDTCGVHYDAGMAIVELTSTNLEKKPDLKSYDLTVRNDVGRFFGTVESYIESYVPLSIIKQPECYYRGHWNKDFLLCNDFEVFQRMSPQERELVSSQLVDRSQEDWKHASQKIKRQNLHMIGNYKETSLYNHGEHVHHQLIEPFVRKLTGLGADAISSLYHRRLWSPLYYPETIKTAAEGTLDRFGDTVIHYPVKSSFKGFADVFLNLMRKMDNVDVILDPILAIDQNKKSITFDGDHIPVTYDQLAWGGNLFEGQRLLGVSGIKDAQSQRANLTFSFLVLDKKLITREFSILFVLDGNVPCYRVTNQSVCSGEEGNESRLIVEYNTDHLAQRGITSKEEVQVTTASTLIELGIIASHEAILRSDIKMIPQLLPLCHYHYNECSQANIELLKEKCPEVCLMGDASGISTRSFADNVVQGLKYSQCSEV